MSALPEALVPIPGWDQLPAMLSWQEKIAWLAHKMQPIKAEPCPVEHIVGNGLYIRKIWIPAGTIFIGRAHKQGHECHLTSGSLIWITPTGRHYCDAPLIARTVPGFHMVLYAISDIEGQTVHANPTESTDTEALEAAIFEPAATLFELGAKVDERLRLTHER